MGFSAATPSDVVSTAGAAGASSLQARADHTHKLIDTGWLFPTLLNGWVNYTAPGVDWGVASYRKIGNVVFIKGLIKSGSGVIFVLPAGFRPGTAAAGHKQLFDVETDTGHGRMDVRENGEVARVAGGNGYYGINVVFVADQ